MDNMTKVFFENVDRLIARRHLRRGDVEKAAGLSPGYGSRIRNGEKQLTSACKAGFAEALGVTVEYLCTPHSDEDAETAELTDFFLSIHKQTLRKDIFWQIVPEERIGEEGLEEWEPIFKTFIFFPHELTPDELKQFAGPNPDPQEYVHVPVLGGRSLEMGRDIDGYRYSKISYVHGEAYAKIESIESSLFLYEVDYENSDGSKQIKNIVEAYLLKGREGYFLCSSAWAPFELATLLGTLYQSAADQASSSRLQEEAHKLIKQYNEQKEKE